MEATLRSIFRKEFAGYRQQHGLSMDQYKAAQAIMDCQSEALGHESWACLEDGHEEIEYHSCRHRSCPRCHQARTHDWLNQIKGRLLPCDHYHVVFTLPHELNPIWHFNRRWCSDHLFRTSAECLRELLRDERYLGAEVGLISSLHTWGRTLSFHPHMHVLVTGGGLADGDWCPVRGGYLVPVAVLKAKFRGKWLNWLNRAYASGDIQLPSDWRDSDWSKALRQVARKHWNVRIQERYTHGVGVAAYPSRYIRGGAIKDRRLISHERGRVSFQYRDHRDGREKSMVLRSNDFMSRVLWHVPVNGQHTIRYYGLYVPGAEVKRGLVREALGAAVEKKEPRARQKERNCPQCGSALYHRSSTRRQISSIRYEGVQQDVNAAFPGSAVIGVGSMNNAAPYFFRPCIGRIT